MKISKKTVANKLVAYLRHEQPLGDLVNWAENAIQEGDFDQKHVKTIAAVVGRLGLADVREFGLTWEDCERMLKQLGFSARIDIVAA